MTFLELTCLILSTLASILCISW